MFCKAALIATVSLALLASANPLERATSDGVRIPLTRRNRLVKEDGTFDLAHAIEHTVRICGFYSASAVLRFVLGCG